MKSPRRGETKLRQIDRSKTHIVLLTLLPLLQIVLFGFKFDYGLPQFGRLGAELVDRQALDLQGLDANAQRNFLLLFQLLLCLAALDLRRREIALHPKRNRLGSNLFPVF